jgi:hypothetical protein
MKKTRITVDLNPHDYGRLERLERTLEAGSKVEVIRRAIKLYGFVAQHVADGGTRETVVLLGLPGAAT